MMSARKALAICGACAGTILTMGTATAGSYSYTLIRAPGAYETEASSINDNGVVAGSYFVYHLIGGLEIAIFHGFVFDHGAYTIIDPPGSASTMVSGIANDGTIIGTYSPDLYSGQKNGFILKDGVYSVFGQPGYMSEITAISHDGAYTIGDSVSYSGRYFSISTTHDGVPGHVVLKGHAGRAFGINAQGTGVGGGFYPRDFIIPQDMSADRPLRPIPLPGPRLPSQRAAGINDSGAFVGTFDRQESPLGYVNSNGVITIVQYPGSDATFADAINNEGDVLGESATASSLFIGFVLHQGKYTQLDNLPMAGAESLAGINSSRQVALSIGKVSYLATPH